MKKNTVWIKSLVISLTVATLMVGAGFYLLAGESEAPLAGGLVEAASYEQSAQQNKKIESAPVPEKAPEESAELSNAPVIEANVENNPVEAQSSAPEAPVAVVASGTNTAEHQAEPAAVQSSSSAPVDHRAQNNQATAVVSETPAPAALEQNVTSTAPVTYSWGASGSYTFRMEVTVTNSGADTSRNVIVSVPLLENSSPYQTTTLKSTNYAITSTSGRVSTFNLGDIAPGETKTVTADFDINVRAISINSTNETVEKARTAYEKYAGSGNCRDLALGFIREAQSMGVTAREVIGFARPQRGAMTSGSLQGTRHSWAEFYVEELGWVPVDLTFQYFGTFPQTSHIVESYGDQSIKVNYTGGSLGASWSNMIL